MYSFLQRSLSSKIMEKEKENCFRFFYLMVEVVPEILRFRLKQSYGNSNPKTLPYFLNETDVIHTLFHLFYPSYFCCWNGCRIHLERPKGFSKEQWNILYDSDSDKCCKKNPKDQNKICICCFTSKNIDENVLDLSLLCLILNNCSNLMPNEKQAVQQIREMKNDHVSHIPSCRLSKSDFLILWEKAELHIKHLDNTNIYLHQRENLLKGPIDESLMQQYFVQCLDTMSEIKIVHASIDKGNEDIKNIKETVDKMNSYLINMQRQEPRNTVDKRKREEPTKCSDVSNEEDNYIRMCLLLTGISPRAVRTLFEKEFSPACLCTSLLKEYNKLLDLKKKRIINISQWDLLFPKIPDVPDSKTFDPALMITLLRNLTQMNPPSCGFDRLPSTTEISEAADLARIKHYRNYLARLDDVKIKHSFFTTAWDDITSAIERLGGQQMKLECEHMKTKPLGQTNQEIMVEIMDSHNEMRELKQSLERIKQSDI